MTNSRTPRTPLKPLDLSKLAITPPKKSQLPAEPMYDPADPTAHIKVPRLLQSQVKTLTENYKLTPATLAHRLNPNWVPAPHLMYISARIAAAIAKGNARIIISVPPRHGKSELITKYSTVWCLEHYPHWNTILATYGAELSNDFGREVRDIIGANEDLLNVRIRGDARRVARWKTPEGGGMAAVGIGGAITGRGANVLLIDDYIKDIKEALSKSYKDHIWNWFKTVAYSRIEPGGSCIIIATRWSRDDLIGRILDQYVIKGSQESLDAARLRAEGKKVTAGPEWEYIKIPALAEEGDLLGRPVGAALFPERYNEATLLGIKDTLGSYFFNALYQQDPRNDENALTNPAWLEKKIIDVLPMLGDMPSARIWDLAATQDGGDYTVGLQMYHDRKTNTTYITDVQRKRASPQAVEFMVRQTALMDGTESPIYIEQEPGSSGKSLVEHYAKSVLPEFKITAVSHNDGKMARAQPFLAACEAGRVYLIKGSWNADFISEFGTFGMKNSPHDDQIDCASVGFTKLSGKKLYSATWGRNTGTSDGPTNLQSHSRTPSSDAVRKARAGITFGRRRL